MKDNKDKAFLIKQYLETKCSPEELKSVISLFLQNDQNKDLETFLYEYWMNTPSFKHQIAREELDQMLDSIHHQINLTEQNGLAVKNKVLMFATRAAAVLFIPLLVASIWMFALNEHKQANNLITLETPIGSKLKTVLPDGTEVWQNSGSTLQYPAKFSGSAREVILTGEAYFHVSSDKKHPFFVKTADGTVKVTGTRFNVSAFPDDNFSSVVLEEGHVSFFPAQMRNEEITLEPDEKIVFLKKSNTFTKSKTDVEKYTSWTEGKLIFRNDPLSEVITKLKRWYNADITLVDETGNLGSHPFTLTIQDETLPQVLAFISEAAGLKFEIIETNNKNSNLLKTKYMISKTQ